MSINYTKASLYPSRSTNGKSPYKTVALVMHSTEGYGRSYLDGLFSGRYKRDDGVGVSVHWCIYRNGDIVEYAPWKPGEAYWMWHAGVSEMPGHGKSLSRKTLGWELEHKAGNAITKEAYDAILYLHEMVQAEYRRAGIELELWTHEQIAWPRGRKTDPTKPFDAPRVYAAWNKPAGGLSMADIDTILKRLDAMQVDIDASQRADSHRSNILIAKILGGDVEAAIAAAKKDGVALPNLDPR